MPRTLSVLVFTLLLAAGSLCARESAGPVLNDETRLLLAGLDSLLARSADINAAKTERIAALRASYAGAADTDRRYWLASELYDEYCAFDSDSALMYADRALELARRMERRDLIDDMQLNRAYIFSATGLLDNAERCLASLDRRDMSTSMVWKYCDRALFLATHRDQYIGATDRDSAYDPVIDSLLQATIPQLSPSDPHYLWFVGWGSMKDRSRASQVIPQVKPVVDASALNTRADAMNAWVLSKLYEYAGDEQQKFKYLILSAMADVRASNKEIASLEELASILYSLGDLERANSYVNYSIACANDYKSRVRRGALASLQERILGAIHTRSERQAARNTRYLSGLIALLVVLVMAILFILGQMRRLRRSREALSRANAELHQRMAELQTTREELHTANARLSELYESARSDASELSAANEAKEAYIANIFTICSNYINKLDDFRKNVHRMIVARRFEETLELTKSPELSHSEVKELYAVFDKTFLQIYPDFVSDFNTLLRPEERLELRNPGQLTTELRIYALVRLGLNDSVKIARFLHVSVQTVYNTRQRARNKAAVPKEQFADAVRALGKPSV